MIVNVCWKKKIEAVAEEEPDALQVDGGPAHELTGLVAVVEAKREPDELRVDRRAHVQLHVERLLPGDQAAARHHGGPCHPEHQDRPDQPRNLAVLLLPSGRWRPSR